MVGTRIEEVIGVLRSLGSERKIKVMRRCGITSKAEVLSVPKSRLRELARIELKIHPFLLDYNHTSHTVTRSRTHYIELTPPAEPAQARCPSLCCTYVAFTIQRFLTFLNAFHTIIMGERMTRKRKTRRVQYEPHLVLTKIMNYDFLRTLVYIVYSANFTQSAGAIAREVNRTLGSNYTPSYISAYLKRLENGELLGSSGSD